MLIHIIKRTDEIAQDRAFLDQEDAEAYFVKLVKQIYPISYPEYCNQEGVNQRDYASAKSFGMTIEAEDEDVAYEILDLSKWERNAGFVDGFCNPGHVTAYVPLADQVKDLTAQLAAAQKELATTKETLTHYDRWLQGGVYYTNEEATAMAEDQAQKEKRAFERGLASRKDVEGTKGDASASQPFLYYLAEDNITSTTGTPGEDQDDVYERFNKEHGMYPLRVLGVTKVIDGAVEAQVVWEADEEDESPEDEA